MKCLPLKNILMRPSNKYGYLKKKCADVETAVSELEDKNQALQSNVFSLSRFSSDEAMLFYTGFPGYKVFLASFEYLDPGDNIWRKCQILVVM